MSDNRPLEHANSFTRNIGRLVCWRFQTPYIYATLAAVSIFYIFVVVHTPLAIWPTEVHDDGLFISLGRYISEGRWLGPFNQFTLMKGPGYPLFLAIGNWLGVPVTFSHSLFHCFAVTFFVFVAYTFMRSFLLSATLYVLLLWHPVLITRLLQRILREQIYSGILLVALAATVYALLSDGSFKQRLLLRCDRRDGVGLALVNPRRRILDRSGVCISNSSSNYESRAAKPSCRALRLPRCIVLTFRIYSDRLPSYELVCLWQICWSRCQRGKLSGST